jgi:hypothetical protein
MADANYYGITALLPFDGVNNAVVFPDAGVLNSVFTPVGNVKISTARSKYRSGSAYFDGAGSYLRAGPSPAFVMTGLDYTIEVWIYPLGYGAQLPIVELRPVGNGSSAGIFYLTPSGKLTYYDGAVRGDTGTAPTLNAWNHVAFTRKDGTLRAFLNGVLQWTAAGVPDFGATAPVLFVGADYTGATTFYGNMSEFQITKYLARWTADFTPPGMLDTGALSQNKSLRTPAPLIKLGAPMVTAKLAPGAFAIRDAYYGGSGRVRGTTKIDGTPSDTPVRRRVRLIQERDGVVIREQWSNAATGAYDFTNILLTQQYSVLTYDHTHSFRAVVADNITPEAMP